MFNKLRISLLAAASHSPSQDTQAKGAPEVVALSCTSCRRVTNGQLSINVLSSSVFLSRVQEFSSRRGRGYYGMEINAEKN